MAPALRLVAVVAAAFLFGCSGSRGLITQPLGARVHRMPARQATVHVTDLRQATVAAISVPVVTDLGERQQVSLAVDPAVTERMMDQLSGVLTGTGDPIHFEVEVIEATAGWLARGLTEEEFARVKLRVEAREALTGRVIAACAGASSGQSWSLDTSEAQVRDIHQRVFLNAFDRCLTDDFIVSVSAGLAGGSTAL